jgi:serine/threonine protein kinase
MAAQNNASLPDGLEVAGYRIVKKIASGGFSIVYLAYDGDGNAVAIKEYLPSALALRQPGELTPVISAANLPVFRLGLKCFFEEGRALASISHPNVVRVLNFFRAYETVYMVMAYESGRSLQEHIQRQQTARKAERLRLGTVEVVSEMLPERVIRHVFAQLINGLREVHACQLLHLDLKPANIYLRLDGTPILLDFGSARQALKTDLPKLVPMYTPGFAPPELYVKTASLGPWSDIYSLGASMFCSMTGVPPQPADERKTEDNMDRQFDKLSGIYSLDLLALVRWCLAVEPLARPQSLFVLQKGLAEMAPLATTRAAAGGLTRKLGSAWQSLFGRRVEGPNES